MIQAQKQGLVRVRELLAPTPDSPLHAAIHATEELGKYPTLFKVMHEHDQAPRIVWPEARNVPHWEADKYDEPVSPGSHAAEDEHREWSYSVMFNDESHYSVMFNDESHYDKDRLAALGFKKIRCKSCGECKFSVCRPE